MLDHMKTLKQGGENGRQPRPQWPGCFCRKMSCPNGSRKLHSVQKIHPAPSSHNLDMLYFPHVVRFSVAIEATIFRIERRAIEAQRLQSIFTFLSIFLYRRQ